MGSDDACFDGLFSIDSSVVMTRMQHAQIEYIRDDMAMLAATSLPLLYAPGDGERHNYMETMTRYTVTLLNASRSFKLLDSKPKQNY